MNNSINFKRHLTNTGHRSQPDEELVIDRIKLNHVKQVKQSRNINWSTVCFILAMPNLEYHSLVFDSTEGIYKVKESPDRLIQQLIKHFPMSQNWLVRGCISKTNGIQEYVPVVCGGFEFFPLKTRKDTKSKSWVCKNKISNHFCSPYENYTTLAFQGCSPIIIPASYHFISKRINETEQVKAYIAKLKHEVDFWLNHKANEFNALNAISGNTEEIANFCNLLVETISKESLKALDYEDNDHSLLKAMIRFLKEHRDFDC